MPLFRARWSTLVAAIVLAGAVACAGEGVGPEEDLICGEAECTAVTATHVSHFTGIDCKGLENYATSYNGNDGVRRSWNGIGRAGTIVRSYAIKSYRSGVNCVNQWLGDTIMTDLVRIYRDPVTDVNPICGEATCAPVQGSYISHFTELNCEGQESYYTGYNGFDGIRRSWDGLGQVGTTLRTITHKSFKMGGACDNAWPTGNTLSDFVRIYR